MLSLLFCQLLLLILQPQVLIIDWGLETAGGHYQVSFQGSWTVLLIFTYIYIFQNCACCWFASYMHLTWIFWGFSPWHQIMVLVLKRFLIYTLDTYLICCIWFATFCGQLLKLCLFLYFPSNSIPVLYNTTPNSCIKDSNAFHIKLFNENSHSTYAHLKKKFYTYRVNP